MNIQDINRFYIQGKDYSNEDLYWYSNILNLNDGNL